MIEITRELRSSIIFKHLREDVPCRFDFEWEITVGPRPLKVNKHFSPIKRNHAEQKQSILSLIVSVTKLNATQEFVAYFCPKAYDCKYVHDFHTFNVEAFSSSLFLIEWKTNWRFLKEVWSRFCWNFGFKACKCWNTIIKAV